MFFFTVSIIYIFFASSALDSGPFEAVGAASSFDACAGQIRLVGRCFCSFVACSLATIFDLDCAVAGYEANRMRLLLDAVAPTAGCPPSL